MAPQTRKPFKNRESSLPAVGLEPTLPKKRDFESRASTNSATPAWTGRGVFRAPYRLSSGPSWERRCCPLGVPRISPRMMASRAALGVASCSRIGRRPRVRDLGLARVCLFCKLSRALASAGLRAGLGTGLIAGTGSGSVVEATVGLAEGRGGGVCFSGSGAVSYTHLTLPTKA